MTKKEYECTNCEAEFYVETEDDVVYCISCGEELDNEEDPLYEEDEVDEWEE